MSALIPEGLEPLAVWDAKGAEWPFGWWLITRLTEHARNFSRIEFYVFDGPFAVVYPQNPAPPVIVPLAELPPAHLLKG